MKNFLFKFFLFFFLFSFFIRQDIYGEYKGIFFGRAEFDSSVPFIFGSKFDTTVEKAVSYGDYYFDQFTIPFHVSLDLAYLAAFSDVHKLLTFWKIKYSDDPVNFLFDEKTKDNLNAAKFNSQNLNNFFLLKYIWNALSYLEVSPSISFSIDLSRETKFESFLKNYYNNQIYSFYIDFNFKNLGEAAPALRSVSFKTYLGYSFNRFPNSYLKEVADDNPINVIPASKEDYHNLDFGVKNIYNFFTGFYLISSYRLNYSHHLEKPIRGDNLSIGYTDVNEKILKHNLDINLQMGFLRRSSYNFLDILFAYKFQYFDSNYVNNTQIPETQKGSYPVPGDAVLLNDQYNFYQKDFKNYFLNVVGLYTQINFTENHGLNLSYSFSLKNFISVYGRLGRSIFGQDSSSSSTSSSGEISSQKINAFGQYTDEKRIDFAHSISLGYVWKSSKKDRSISPFFGVQLSSSNDHTEKINRHIYMIGTKLSYEF